MPSKFDEYLNKGGFTQQDAKAAQVERAEDVQDNSAPTPVSNDPEKARPDAPQPRLNQETQDRIESTQKGAGNNYEQQSKPSLSERYPSSQSKGQEPNKQQENEQDNER